MKLSVAYAAGSNNFWQELELDSPITVEQAIQKSRLSATFNELDFSILKVGIFGKVCPKNTQLEEGDRVEVYQPIIAKASDDEEDDDF